MFISELDPDKLSDQQMTNLLFSHINEDLQAGECIFVFGSSKADLYRLPKAIELYKEGRANKILLSGGVIWDGNTKTEAERLKEKALDLGVPENDLLIEKESRHTKENVLASLLVLDRTFNLHNIKRLLIVTNTYHMRRTYLTLKTYMPGWIDYSLCPVNDQTTRMENWFLTEYGRKRVETEAKKLITYVKQGIITDHDITM